MNRSTTMIVVAGLLLSPRATSPVAAATPEVAPSPEPSPRPLRKEWNDAPVISLDRNAAGCEARAIHEWVRVTCSSWEDVTLLGGSAEGVELYQGATWGLPPIHVVFPVRRGDRRVFQFLNVRPAFRYSPGEVNGGAILSAQWLEGEEPTIVVH